MDANKINRERYIGYVASTDAMPLLNDRNEIMTLANGTIATVAESQALMLQKLGFPAPVITRPVKVVGRVSDCAEGHERYAVVPIDPDTGDTISEFDGVLTVAELTEHTDPNLNDVPVLAWGGGFFPAEIVQAEINSYLDSQVAQSYAELEAEIFAERKLVADGLDPDFLE